MKANVVISPAAANIVRDSLPGVTDWFDSPPKVSLLTGDWVAADPTTWPAVSPQFAAINGTAATTWEVLWDAVESNWKLLAPEPVGGWDFVSSGAGESITGFKVENAGDTDNKIGAIRFANAIPVTAAGEHIVLPNVSLPLQEILAPVDEPYVLA